MSKLNIFKSKSKKSKNELFKISCILMYLSTF